MAERQQPEETIELLNTFYTLMFDAIGKHGGLVSQIIGDGIMAVFGAPTPLRDSAGSAALAALEMVYLIDTLNGERSAGGDAPVKIGVGIATGDVIAGYTGTQSRATYTCVGDTVNIAARLEAHTRLVGHSILIEAATARLAAGAVTSIPIGDLELKGKRQRVSTFAVPTRYPN